MVRKIRQIAAGQFKTHILRLLDEVAETGEEIEVTKRGKVIAKLVPAEEMNGRSRRGTLTYHGDIVEPLDDEWETEK